MPKEKTPYRCLLLIVLESVIRKNKKHYSQKLLEECKYIIKRIKLIISLMMI